MILKPTVKVKNETYYILTLTLDEEVAKSADHITVKYGADDGTYETVTAAYTANATTATAALKKSLANSYYYFNGIAVTVYDSSDNEISTEQDLNYFIYTTPGATIKISAYTEQTMTFTLSFSGDNGAVSKVSLLYYPADGETSAGTEVEGTVSDESVSFTLSKKYASSWGYNAEITAYDSDSNDVTLNITGLTSKDTTFGGNTTKSWWAFAADGTTTVSATYSTGKQVSIKTEESVTTSFENSVTSGYTQILDSSNFKDSDSNNLSIGTLIVTISSDTTYAWASVSGAASYAEKTYKNNAINTTVYITTSTFINAVFENGLYMESSAGTFTVSVSYIEGEPEDDTEEEVSYTYTQVGSDNTSYTGTGSLITIAESSSFSSIETIDAIKIEVSSVSQTDSSNTSSWWFTLGYTVESTSTWLGESNPMSWDSTISGYSAVITDSDTISAIKTNGLQLASLSGLSATVKVYTGVKASE